MSTDGRALNGISRRLSKELKAYASQRGVRVMQHTALSDAVMECARALVDEFVRLVGDMPPGCLAVDIPSCPVHRLTLWLERDR